MSKTQRILMTSLVVVLLAVALLAWRVRQPPVMPADSAHTSFVNPKRCLVCHGPDGESPRTVNHPVGQDCARCHGFARR